MKLRAHVALVFVGALVLMAAHAQALSSLADKCEATKLSTAGKYDFCRLKAEAKAAKKGGAPDFSKCDPSFSGKWSQAETLAGGSCPTNGDAAATQAFITEHTDAIEAALDGGTLPEGVLSCNADLATCKPNLSTCDTSLATCLAGQPPSQPLKTGQTTAYGTGSDGNLQKGDARSYTDNGDGTITDNKTGLMWEKKSQDGTIHDYGNMYTWSGASYGSTDIMDGTITSTFLAGLDGGGGFAGHTDWRIPNRFELETLVNLQGQLPAVDPAFNTSCVASCTVLTCSCTQSDENYWSSTTYAQEAAWYVDFFGGEASFSLKSYNRHVRAVRSGS